MWTHDTSAMTFGQRLRGHRERAGKTRAVLGGLVGRSEEWVKALETGRLLAPRLPMLLRLAEVLGLDDLAELTGAQPVPVASITKAGHPATGDVAAAMRRTVHPGGESPTPEALADRVMRTWMLWHQSDAERSAIAPHLPDLITDARAAVRLCDDAHRRAVLATLAGVWHLTQLFLAFQPQEELVWLAADRAMTAAYDSDDPKTIAVAAWYQAHVYRSAGQPEAAEAVALDGLALLDPEKDVETLARWGQLHVACALAHANAGRGGQAWRHWDKAMRAARTLGAGYCHPWLMFGQATVEAYAVTVAANLVQPGEAVRRSELVEPVSIPSRTRRALLLLETARAHRLRREHVAVAHLIGRAQRESWETVRHSVFARQAVLELLERRGPLREDARELAFALDLDR